MVQKLCIKVALYRNLIFVNEEIRIDQRNISIICQQASYAIYGFIEITRINTNDKTLTDNLITTDIVYSIIYFESQFSVRHAVLISSPFAQYVIYESFECEKEDWKKTIYIL